jgi:hypothetical protein
MGQTRRGIQVLDWLSIIAGYGFALLLIRGIFLLITRGFGADPSHAPFVVLGYLLFLALCVYLFNLGRRALLLAKGFPQPKPRFGWGRILLGSIFLYSNAVRHFHLIPARFKPLQPSNDVEAVSMNITEGVLFIGCLLLIFSGIWRGLRRQTQANVSV